MGRLLHALWMGGLLLLVSGCIVPEAKPSQLGMARRYRTPEETFESLRTAFQAEVLEWEYECFSLGFIDANNLSNLAYRAFRPELLAKVPRFRWGLSRAVIEEVTYQGEALALLRARIPVPFLDDPVILLGLVREEYIEVFVEDVVAAEALDQLGDHIVIDRKRVGDHGEGSLWLLLSITPSEDGSPLTDEQLEQGFSFIRGGREWKVDQIGLADKAAD
ncbi:MAG: hypothetical protein O2816_00455 [Planctomycetota bacterium]|nr:hypothetical protein [Planctomycetota bacterium]